ncbi:hypothetical protein GCM10011613_05440 [Cellvibrio zantedeschiae]|uniref:site-specific DNA-methyltransferase (cytosine-N(4)-specific) n=1 Tax=Cellvibrio zantedeschiae TaxID=1237077 RepID=A0ABQ3AUK6_9GAMM|nr:hypothetical protein [Cellvibrio zantedeschiae]GGY64578.1 hypothetical protein GCM10011613_05440 [Cellvibrio zantedeschiae]
MLIINPKRINEPADLKSFWYNYYAGYSHTFTKNVIESSGLRADGVIFDPWNGAGTTTLMASVAGYSSIGLDLNPVMKIIASAKQATKSDVIALQKQLSKLTSKIKYKQNENDALSVWFKSDAIANIRTIESFILNQAKYFSTESKVDSLTILQCLMYTALFNCIRELLKNFIPSNPTWIKRPKSEAEKISVAWSSIKNRYKNIVSDMVLGVDASNHTWSSGLAQLVTGTSLNIPLPDNSVDMVLTSPPYCTRIDYGVATLPELALLAEDGIGEVEQIRRSLMGTTTVPREIDSHLNFFGDTCDYFLKNVYGHASKASTTYYYKNLYQYFVSLKKSISEISRVIKKDAKFICVVQDSYYKDIHCNLPRIIEDMSLMYGLFGLEKIEFESKKNMGNLNVKSKVYRKNNTAFETVLIFKKG